MDTIKPDDHEALCRRGDASVDKGDYDSATADYTAVLRVMPNYGEALCSRGYAYAEEGDHDCAIENYTEALRIKPD